MGIKNIWYKSNLHNSGSLFLVVNFIIIPWCTLTPSLTDIDHWLSLDINSRIFLFAISGSHPTPQITFKKWVDEIVHFDLILSLFSFELDKPNQEFTKDIYNYIYCKDFEFLLSTKLIYGRFPPLWAKKRGKSLFLMNKFL